MNSERIEHLQSLVNDYKSTFAIMEKKIEDLGGDSPALTGGRLPKDLVAELDAEKAAKLAVQQGALFCFIYIPLADHLSNHDPQLLKRHKQK